MRVGKISTEDLVEDPGKERISDIAVERDHRAVEDLSLEPGADYEVSAFIELPDQEGKFQKVIGIVCIPDNDIPSTGMPECLQIGVPISPVVGMHDDGAHRLGYLWGRIG